MASNFASGGLCGPTAIGWAQAIVGAGIINVDIANIVILLRSTGEYRLKITKREQEKAHTCTISSLLSICDDGEENVLLLMPGELLTYFSPRFDVYRTEIGKCT